MDMLIEIVKFLYLTPIKMLHDVDTIGLVLGIAWILLVYGLSIVAIYFILYPLIWKRQYFDHQIKAKVTDKSVESSTTYIKSGDVLIPSTTHYHYVTFKPIDKLPFIKGKFKEDIEEDTFDQLTVGDEVVLKIQEKHRRFRLSSNDEMSYYGFDLLEVGEENGN